MYESFYGLTRKPFELHPDPDYVYMSPAHDDVYTHLRYATEEGKGFVVITGEIGSGKTTLINYLVRRVPQRLQVAIISNTSVPPVQFLHMVCDELGLDASRGKVGALRALGDHLDECRRNDVRVTLIIDEAQNLPLRTLEELRMLSNLGAQSDHLLQIILVGQPELREKLRHESLEQLLQRVTVHCHLEKLDREELGRYVEHRLQVAGADGCEIFEAEALDAVYEHSRGTPRLINILCDTALVYGFGDERSRVDRGLIDEVVETRKAGGLFGICEMEKARPAPRKADGADDATLEKRLSSLEIRIRGLETSLEDVVGSLESLRVIDQLFVELFGVLLKDKRGQADGRSKPSSPSPEGPGTPRTASTSEMGRALREVLGGKGG